MIRSRAAVLLAAGLAVGCGAPRPVAIVCITLDTTRADRLGCYGYARAETPNLDQLATGGTRFDAAQTPVPVTLPSHSSMFTGQTPPVHGIRHNAMFVLAESAVTVAELMRDSGWETAGVPGAYPLQSGSGIEQGFGTFRDLTSDEERSDIAPGLERQASEITDLGIELIRQRGERPLFLWLHYWDAHDPYEPPFPFSARFRDRPYDGEIAYIDREIGRLFDAVREEGLWDNALVIVAGDHGEALYEHNERSHAYLVYQSTLRVPLIVKPPGRTRAHVVEEPVSLIDVAPTILDFAGVEGPEMEGISLKPAVFGRTPPTRSLYFESLVGSLVHGWGTLEGLRRGRWKYTRSSEPELYDLQADPGETNNVHSYEGNEVLEIGEQLDRFGERWRRIQSSAEVQSTPLDDEEREKLGALGYLGGFVTDERRDGPHPKDRIHVELELLLARDAMLLKEYEDALMRYQLVLEDDRTNRFALNGAAGAAMKLGDMDLALEYATKALEVYPEFTPARLLRGMIFVAQGELGRAEAEFREGLAHRPDDAGLQYRQAVTLYALGRVEEARDMADRMIEAEAELPLALVLRAACRATLGDPAAALTSLQEAIDSGYDRRDLLLEEPHLADLRAVSGFDRAIESLPDS